jgi:hypothetical protein
MAKVIRVYDSQETAAAAAAALKEKGFTSAVTETPDGTAAVEVAPPFGRGAEAEALLNSFGPIASPAPKAAAPVTVFPKPTATVFDNAAPFSTALGLSVLTSFESGIILSPDPAPLSSKLGWKVLSTDKPKAELKSDWTLSGALGWKLLADTPASETSRTVLSDDPSPLSKAFGMPVLSNDPTPLSSALGMKVLAERQ